MEENNEKVTGKAKERVRLIVILLLPFILGLSINFVLKPTVISGSSMSPTLENGHRILLNTLKKTYDRGDIVVFHTPDDRLFIKRVIGVEGDSVEIKDGFVHLNGKKLEEFYINGQGTLFGQEMVVPKGHVYVMGDNRSNSIDSRVIGAVPEGEIIGSLMLRVLPILKGVEKAESSLYEIEKEEATIDPTA